MKRLWLPFALLLCCSIATAADAPVDGSRFLEGLSYEALTPVGPTDVKPGQIEVIEFYWYGCPHCFALEPYVEAWEKAGLPKDVVFKRVPESAPDSQFYVDAQAAFTADQLGIAEKIREPLYNAIHLDQDEPLRTDEDALRQFFGKFAVKPADFDAAWGSAAVQAALAHAQKLEDADGIQGVPIIVIDGKWKTGAGHRLASGEFMKPADIMDCVQFLIARQRTAHQVTGK
ncbi:MAG TPA: thiol:disulfide interchange protein DsbA/DsbL [Gammaproteobacteria bacterium]|jgi:thiol:disulfide interchange protein DsbA|nr:thiol:disulfide interchange protein DsbA/DsbL [Gammaproteobacteria bacterium]